MSKAILVILGWMVFSSTFILAQNNDSETAFKNQRRDAEDLTVAANLSPASRIMHQRFLADIEGRDGVKILQDALLVGDRSVIPYLEARRKLGLGPNQHLDIVLVQFGETQYVDLAIEETKSEDSSTRYWATWRLIRFKTKESYRRLYEMLDDVKDRNDYKADDYTVQTVSWATMDLLSLAVENPPKERRSVAAWKDWFKTNNLIN